MCGCAVGFGDSWEETMPTRTGARLAQMFFRLAVSALVGLGSANLALAQRPLASQLPPAVPSDSPAAPTVIPAAPEGGTPPTAPLDSQQAPGVGQFFRPASAPMPDYVYQPAYYETPRIGARA